MGRIEGFDWNDWKDDKNLSKHGIPLRFAVLLFQDTSRLERLAKTVHGELRFLAIGKIGGSVLSCVFTIENGERHLLSLRPASRKERRSYADQADTR